VNGFQAAVAFLTRVHVGGAVETGKEQRRSVLWFPVVGALLGLVAAGAYATARLALPAVVAGALTVGVTTFLTRALHEDGLADTADALGGGWNREERLAILKDPVHGTYGVLALILSVVLRVTAIGALGAWAALGVLPAAHALSRAASVALLGWVGPATIDGLGATYSSSVTRSRARALYGIGSAIGLVSLGVWGLPAAILAGLAAAMTAWLGVRMLGGITGDVLGAAQQAGEILVLLLGAAVATNGSGLPWWR
jgi:adenosylcobinamide-GDP ribazoletransferase